MGVHAHVIVNQQFSHTAGEPNSSRDNVHCGPVGVTLELLALARR